MSKVNAATITTGGGSLNSAITVSSTGNVTWNSSSNSLGNSIGGWYEGDDLREVLKDPSGYLYVTDMLATPSGKIHLHAFEKKYAPKSASWSHTRKDTEGSTFAVSAFRYTLSDPKDIANFHDWFDNYGKPFDHDPLLMAQEFLPPPPKYTDGMYFHIVKRSRTADVARYLIDNDITDVCLFAREVLGFRNKNDLAQFILGFDQEEDLNF